jgi:hypothetical protein
MHTHGVAPPAEAPDGLATLVGQGVIDEQSDAAGRGPAGEDVEGDAVAEIRGIPGETLEEVSVNARRRIAKAWSIAVGGFTAFGYPPAGYLPGGDSF